MYKVLLDTNVLINGVQDGYSYTYKIIEACIAGELVAISSPIIQKEYRLLARRLLTDAEYLNLLDDYYETAQEVLPRIKNDVISADPEDNKFIDAAFEARADYIITSDRHLLDLEEFEGTKIATPSEFWHFYKGKLADEDEGESDWQDWAKDIGIG